MATVTAKVLCRQKVETGEGDARQALVSFEADYQDGRNKEWSIYTPHLALSMTLKGAAADLFEPHQAYTLTFEPSTD
ncbi:hypothetical protein [Peterkaempfera sp. SMS 1(5)a]|uniref:hypothetical protein n=1 Tax=Peterkaempfera podocarpi TaxID=3232308 RepID=UPI0036712DE8